jgi:hypothetical protein
VRAAGGAAAADAGPAGGAVTPGSRPALGHPPTPSAKSLQRCLHAGVARAQVECFLVGGLRVVQAVSYTI